MLSRIFGPVSTTSLGKDVPPAAKQEYYNNVAYYWNNYEEFKKRFEANQLKRVLVIDNGKVVGDFDSVPDAHGFMGENSSSVSPRSYVTCIGDEEAPTRVLLTPRDAPMFYTSSGSDYKPQGPLTNGRGPYKNPFGAYIYGPVFRPYIVLPIKTAKMSDYLYVDFFIDTGCPLTTITRDVYTALGLTEDVAWFLDVANTYIPVQPSSRHYENICLLGESFLKNKILNIDYSKKTIDIS